MKKGMAQIPLILVLLVLAVSLPVLTLVANQNTENRSKASGSCNENCSNVKNGSSWMIQSCSPPDSDGSTQDSLCSWTGRVEACGGVSNYYCCPSSGAQWTQSMTTECNASLAKLTPTSVVPTIVPTMPVTGSKMVKFVFSYAGIKQVLVWQSTKLRWF